MPTQLINALTILLVFSLNINLQAEDIPQELKPWLVKQNWVRDTNGPIISIGEKGEFDDMHLFAPAVALENNRYSMWYCGSRGEVKNRVFNLGLATSNDGREFQKYQSNPVLKLKDGHSSILTPTLLRSTDGKTLRHNGLLRMWFSSTNFKDKSGLHTLHEMTSKDGIHWSNPSKALLNHVYAPTIIKRGKYYQMWYTDVENDPWIIRHATSLNGLRWRVTPEPSLVIDQQWEKERLFYPTVVKIKDAYLMWYGSYQKNRKNSTALGFAVSIDGIKWYKHSSNPVLQPDISREWESNYVTSQSIMQYDDNSFRIWYASRKKPPFINKYFALNTAKWSGIKPVSPEKESANLIERSKNHNQFIQWRDNTQNKLYQRLGIPKERVPINAEKRGETIFDDIVIEKWVFTSEPGSKVPAVLYRPKEYSKPMPAIVLTFGHGASKSHWAYNYAGQLYAKLGIACLALDPIGEEERNIRGKTGTRAHDPRPVHYHALNSDRMIMGKLVFDTMRGIDFLLARNDINNETIGVVGNSLGGATSAWVAALEPRLKMAIVSGWAYDNVGIRSKYCTKVPNQIMREICTWPEYVSLAAPHCSLMVMNGNADWIIDTDDNGAAWRGTQNVVDQVSKVYHHLNHSGQIKAWFEKGGGHRPYMLQKEAIIWIHNHIGTPKMSLEQIQNLPTINSGEWCNKNSVKLETLYKTRLHQVGATLPDLGIKLIPTEELSCLKPEERGTKEFTIEGWLKLIQKN